MEQWRLGFLVPLAAAIATAIFIVAIGELLLALGGPVVLEFGDTKVFMAALISLAIAIAILAVSAFVARGGARSRE